MPTRIEQLASNDTMYYRGDQCMEIAPFDNYYLFTIYKESTDSTVDDSTPLNLTNLGSLYLTFSSGDNEIVIENYKEVESVDMVNGEVVFRISKEDAKKILGLGSKTFYISSKITDGVTESDETVLYTGTWVDFATGMQTSLTQTIQVLNDNIRNLQTKLDNTVEDYEARLRNYESEIESLKNTIASQEATIRELQAVVDTYNSDVVDYITANILSTTTVKTSNPNSTAASREDTSGNKENVSIETPSGISSASPAETTMAIEGKASDLSVNWLTSSNSRKRLEDHPTPDITKLTNTNNNL